MNNSQLFKIITTAAIFFMACGDSSSTAYTANKEDTFFIAENETYLKATINGTAWLANHEVQSFIRYKKIILGGENEEWVINVNIPATTVAGQTITTDEAAIVKKDKSGNIAYTKAENATVKITSKTATSMEGSFSFTATNINGKGSVKVENGKFKTKLMVR